jgi:hypothetical protein
MKLRATHSWLNATREAAAALGVSRSEWVRRALRKFRRAADVELSQFAETTTARNSEVTELDLPEYLTAGLSHGDIRCAVRWALAQRREYQPYRVPQGVRFEIVEMEL